MASGETSQAYAIAKYLLLRKAKVSLALKDRATSIYFSKQNLNFPLYITPSFNDFRNLSKRVNPQIIIFCNSKSYKRDKEFINLKTSPFPNIATFTIDSNWLFNSNLERYPYVKWADLYFINLPEKVFSLGLRKHGGYFSIDQKIAKKIIPVGIIPSYKNLKKQDKENIRRTIGIKPKEKMIFCYFSGVGAAGRPWVLYNLVSALPLIHGKDNIKIIYSGDATLLNKYFLKKYPFLIHSDVESPEYFYQLLASSDLVFQHQGLVTLTQAICANIPVITNVSIYPKTELPGLHSAELKPFHKLNLCKMLYKSTSKSKVASAINTLLYDKEAITEMKNVQKTYKNYGEKEVYKKIYEYLCNKT